MERLRRTLLTLAATSADVVIYGETGAGKELVARCLHDHSDRRRSNFVPLNCGGLSEALAESELFGHEVGAFTGATRVRVGKFEHAQHGTLFLDEIESMPMSVQIKFLRALQERSIERLGTNKPIPIDCRVIAAAKDDLKVLSDKHKFRADLYYRIGVAFIELPPLRERREDIPLLFEHFTLLAASRYQRAAPVLNSAQLADLMAHAWPGNVRELRNVADRFVLGLLGDRMTLTSGNYEMPTSLPEKVEHFERAVITDELRRHHGEVAASAKALGLPKQTFYDKLRRLGITTDEFRCED
jgi:two-component system C4-dicarboxylate transport response regulator DctD